MEIAPNDTFLLVNCTILAHAFAETSPDSSHSYAQKALMLARKLELKLDEAAALGVMGYALMNMANYPGSLQKFLYGIAIAEDPGNEKNILPDKYLKYLGEFRFQTPASAHSLRLQVLAYLHIDVGLLYENAGNYQKELFHDRQAIKLAEQTGFVDQLCFANMILGRLYLSMKKQDSALFFANNAYALSFKTHNKEYLGGLLITLGRIHLARGNYQLANEYFRKSLAASSEQNYVRGLVAASLLLSDINKMQAKNDSSLHFANTALGLARRLNAPDLLLRSYKALTTFYQTSGNGDSLIKYQALIIKINDSLFTAKKLQQFQNIDIDEHQRRQEIELAEKTYRNLIQKYVLLAALGFFLLVAVFLWGNIRHRQKAYALLTSQKQETDFQKAKVDQTLLELKSTQAQLIQSEKMASLGELTAGIAHEIQNPLNFVNNFSEVNMELLAEMREEIDKGNFAEVKIIANGVVANGEKISHHGKRADAIVKGMLQHSRTSSGIKEPTDINALVDEYLRLAYHGLRAKDKSFNASVKTDFDKTVGNINIIPQDIGRVILNLISNAFYAVTEKNKQNGNDSPADYQPTVYVSTSQSGDKVLISVKDNGNGIPQKVLDKIFQPFFTTKPTGQGTGLGLSLSYDIVKAHGGELKVETKEGEGTEFVILLPVQ